MLVFISDLHFTDGTATPTLNPGTFRIFSGLLQDVVDRSTPEYLHIVFLGDIFDLLRSGYWNSTELRPWSEDQKLDEVVREITKRITANTSNMQAIGYLKQLLGKIAQTGVPVGVEYLPGNHDRMINNSAASIKCIAEFLGIENAPDVKFHTEKLWEDHRVFARHGEVFDPVNYEADGGAPLGDAIVTDLLSTFSEEIKKEFGGTDADGILAEIAEIDNVRPLIDIPAYINGICRKHGGEPVVRRVKKVWDRLALEFIKSDVLSRRDRVLKWDIANTVRAALFLTRRFSNGRIADLLSNQRLRDLFAGETYLAKKAAAEEAVKDGKADFVVYGHTHRQAMVPLTGWDGAGVPKESFYFNTGTWRKVFQKARHGRGRNDFARWNVLSFVCIFKDGERVAADGTQRRFEMWTASLG